MLRIDGANRQALSNLEKLHEEQQQWHEARAIRRRLTALAEPGERPRHQAILAFLEARLGVQALEQADPDEAVSRFEAAIALDEGAVPAYLDLGDLQRREGRLAEAIATWDRVPGVAPDRAYLILDRVERASRELGDDERFPALCRRLIDANPQDWRARLALGRHLADRGDPRRRTRPALRVAGAQPARHERAPGGCGRPSRPSASTSRGSAATWS